MVLTKDTNIKYENIEPRQFKKLKSKQPNR